MTTDHAFTCASEGYTMARHNEVRDVLADAMWELLSDVEVEPRLLPYRAEMLRGKTANRLPDAHVDIRARGVWTRHQEAFFDVRVTHLKATLLSHTQVLHPLESHEREKKRHIHFLRTIFILLVNLLTCLLFCCLFVNLLIYLIPNQSVSWCEISQIFKNAVAFKFIYPSTVRNEFSYF